METGNYANLCINDNDNGVRGDLNRQERVGETERDETNECNLREWVKKKIKSHNHNTTNYIQTPDPRQVMSLEIHVVRNQSGKKAFMPG